MFNKIIFKQTYKSNFKIWIIITFALCAMNTVLIGVFNPQTISSMSSMVEGTVLANMIGNTSFTGMLSSTFYSIQAIILILIYIIITADNLIVSQVDRGSMAYTLSTPIKRTTVVFTQITYLLTALFTMISIVTISGFISIQAFHGGVWGKNITEDVKVVSDILNVNKDELSDNLSLILDNEEALKEGASTRGIDKDSYKAYLTLKMNNNAYEAAADAIELDAEEITKDPSMIKDNDEALEAASKVMNMDKEEYSNYLDTTLVQKDMLSKQLEEIQDEVILGFTAGGEILDIEASDMTSSDSLEKLKTNEEALNAAVNESGIPQETFVTVINNKIANNEILLDEGIDFDKSEYVTLNVGLFFLMFAISSIAFMFSCIFNLSRNYMAFGAGIPVAFFLCHMMAQVNSDLEIIKYFTINSLFDTDAILNGGNYGIQFAALGIIGIILYTIGVKVFKAKDLPL